jgi:hypothetical protein
MSVESHREWHCPAPRFSAAFPPASFVRKLPCPVKRRFPEGRMAASGEPLSYDAAPEAFPPFNTMGKARFGYRGRKYFNKTSLGSSGWQTVGAGHRLETLGSGLRQ